MAWNTGILIVVLGFAPVGAWVQSHGAMVPALALGENSWLVQNLCTNKFGWRTGFDEVGLDTEVSTEAQPFVERATQILTALKAARAIEDLQPVVATANLQTVSAWPEKKQHLALRHVSNKIELLNLDAANSKREWHLDDFNQTQQTATLTWQARDPSGQAPTLIKTLKLIKENDQWKADFSDEIDAFNNKMLQRERSRHDSPTQ